MTEQERERHDRFLRLYVENEEALRGFARALASSRDAAREIMQEVAAVLWRKFDELASPEDFRRWAFGIVRFEALAAARDFARDRHVFSDDLLRLLADEAEESADHFEAERQALERCLQKLPEAQRAIVAAAYERGARIDDLATRLGRTAMSLYKLLHRIRLSLAECTKRELAREGLA
jgi:RNA polymerase sigma-70 factor (ECF subfamily)